MLKRSTLLASSTLAAPALRSAMYANILTNLIGQLYAGLDVVSRELVGLIPIVARAPGVERAAMGQQVIYDISPTMAAYDITPAMNIPEPPDVTLGNGSMAITKARAVPFGFTGEEALALNNGVGFANTQAGLFAQGLRALVNEIEADLAAQAIFASRAVGTPGSTPFASGVGDTAQLRKILEDNGAPVESGMGLVINSAAAANMRTNTQLSKANERGSEMTLRDGELLDVHGFSVHSSAQILNFTKGTGAGATTNAAGYAVGATVITLAAAGTGTIKVGDTVQFAGDTNKYLVASGDADTSNGGTITLAAPGLRVAIPAAATAITLGASAAYNFGFTQNALHLVTRPPALPNGRDAAIDSMMITDPRSGMTFEIRIYEGYRKMRAEVALAWGVKLVKPEHAAVLLG